MSETELLLLLEDMGDAARKILRYTNNMMFDDFLLDDKTINPV